MKNKQDSKQIMTLEYLKENARYLDVVIPYYEEADENLITFSDGLMTELESDEEFVNPMLDKENKQLKLLIDLQAAKAIDWNGGYLRMWGKVCDSGYYTLLDDKKEPIWQISGYVPSKLLPPYENGWGDYLEFVIQSDGALQGWRKSLDFADFIEDGEEPSPVPTNKWYKSKWAYWDVRNRKLNHEETVWLIEKLQRSLQR